MARQNILLGGIVKDEVKKVNENFSEVYSAMENIPSKTSDLTNDSNFATTSDVNEAVQGATSGCVTSAQMTTAINNATQGLATTEAMNTGLGGKVDKEAGKGLSSTDYTSAEKAKVAKLGKLDFTASTFGALTNGYYYATIAASSKYPVKVMKANGSKYEEVLVQTSVEGDNIVICSESTFAGYVVTV